MKKLLIALILVTGLGPFNAYGTKSKAKEDFPPIHVTETTVVIRKIKWPKWMTDAKKKLIKMKKQAFIKKKVAEAKKKIKKLFTKDINKIIEKLPSAKDFDKQLKELEKAKKISLEKIKFPAKGKTKGK